MNRKFEDERNGKTLKTFISSLKNEYGIDYVYFWHALAGYWGGVSEDPEDELHSALANASTAISADSFSSSNSSHNLSSLNQNPLIFLSN
jgi:hypothetical protein